MKLEELVLSPAQRAYGEYLLTLEQNGGNLDAFCADRGESHEELSEVALEWAELFGTLPRTAASPELAAKLLERLGGATSDDVAGVEATGARVVPLLPEDPRYSLGEEIGRGGMGAVFEADDRNLRRPVAMKVMLGSFDPNDPNRPANVTSTRLRRFLEEARITGRLDHPGVVPVHELGIDQRERLFFTMRRVRGSELTEVFDLARDGRGGWNQRRALECLVKLCDTVAYAHSRGITHRDLKPSNVLVGERGEVYCLDWGLARTEGESEEGDPSDVVPEVRHDPASLLRTREGAVIGTPGYMSPEQALGRSELIGPRTDVYALGSMLYRLLTGFSPFIGSGAPTPLRETLEALVSGGPEPILVLEPLAPPELVAICERAMERDPARRYAGPSELAADLRAHLEGRVVDAYRAGILTPLAKWVGRHRAPIAASTLALSVILACFVVVRQINPTFRRSRRHLARITPEQRG